MKDEIKIADLPNGGCIVEMDGGGKPNQKHHRPVAYQGIEDGRATWEAVEREVLSR